VVALAIATLALLFLLPHLSTRATFTGALPANITQAHADTVPKLYGVGEITGSQLMAELGDVRRFSGHIALQIFSFSPMLCLLNYPKRKPKQQKNNRKYRQNVT
jgi:hypothetical protein